MKPCFWFAEKKYFDVDSMLKGDPSCLEWTFNKNDLLFRKYSLINFFNQNKCNFDVIEVSTNNQCPV